MEKISVIVPVYNVEAYIFRCVDSILGQSFSDFELILIDDGSPDNCGAICDDYAKRDSRIRVIHQKNGGLSAARNAGIDWVFANSDSQWLTFIDSDDWIHPNYLDALLNAATHTGLPLSSCAFVRTVGDVPTISPNLMVPQKWSSEQYFIEHSANANIACGKLYKKEHFRSIRYPVGLIHEDEHTTYKLLFATEQVAVIEAPLYYYFQNDFGIMHETWSTKKLTFLDALEIRITFFKKNHYKKAYLWQIEAYLHWVSLFYNKLLTFCDQQEIAKYLPGLRKKLRRLLRLCKSERVLRFKDAIPEYEKAYPKFMWLYWTVVGIIHKLRR